MGRIVTKRSCAVLRLSGRAAHSVEGGEKDADHAAPFGRSSCVHRSCPHVPACDGSDPLAARSLVTAPVRQTPVMLHAVIASFSPSTPPSVRPLQAAQPQTEPRPVCYACFRPAAVCYCDHTSRLRNRTHVTVVQHPREQFHPLGTARIVARCLENVELLVAHPGWARGSVAELFPAGAALLYPGSGARDLADIPESERPRALVVLDGTWHHARTLYRDHAVLRQLPLVSFVPSRPTEYRVRREPKAEYVSTVEAVATALELLEPGLGGRDLLPPFRRMIDLHLAATERSARKSRHKKRRAATARALPVALAEAFEQVVLIYGEANPARYVRASRARPQQLPPLAYWTAKRLRDGAVFAEPVRLDPPMTVRHQELLGLTPADLQNAVSLEELKVRWRAFLQPGDRLVAWNRSSFDLLQQLDPSLVHDPAPGHVTLKAVYRGLPVARQRKGALEEVVAAEGLTWEPAAVAGRARDRLGRAEAVARYLHARAR